MNQPPAAESSRSNTAPSFQRHQPSIVALRETTGPVGAHRRVGAVEPAAPVRVAVDRPAEAERYPPW
jgi:hypothetical protein